MTARHVLNVFDTYQKARISFVEQVAEMATHAYNITALESAGALCLLQPLISDMCPAVQQFATTAIGRMANQSSKMAQNIVRMEMLPIMLRKLQKQNKYYKKAIMFTLRAIAKHSVELSAVVLNVGGLEAIIICLEDFDSTVKLSAVAATSAIARHSRTLAQATIDSGALPLLLLCLQEPDNNLKQAAASALADIAGHSPDLAQAVTNCTGALVNLSRALHNPDKKIKTNVLKAFDAIAKHNLDLAEACVEAETFPQTLLHIQHFCPEVSKIACMLTGDVVKQSLDLAQLIVNQGGIGALLEAKGSARIPGYTALGYIAGHSLQLALCVIGADAVPVLAQCLDENENDLQAVVVWSLGQIGIITFMLFDGYSRFKTKKWNICLNF